MEAWQKVWRDGFAPSLSTAGLRALLGALERDDARLIQGHTTEPPPAQFAAGWPVTGACPVAFCAWQGDGVDTVGDVEDFFAKACLEADRRLGEPAAVRYFLNFWDDDLRGRARRLLSAEVSRTLARRGAGRAG